MCLFLPTCLWNMLLPTCYTCSACFLFSQLNIVPGRCFCSTLGLEFRWEVLECRCGWGAERLFCRSTTVAVAAALPFLNAYLPLQERFVLLPLPSATSCHLGTCRAT